MIYSNEFATWLHENTSYSASVIKDTVSRMKRADRIKEWDTAETYIFYLEQESAYKCLSVSVRSQIKKAVKLYTQFNQTGE